MQKIQKWAAVILIMAMIITISSANQIAADAASKTPKLSKTKVSININAVRKLQVKNKPSGVRVKWKSANKKIATVSSKGVVKGINAGKTKVTCAIQKDKESYKLSAQITVNRLDAISAPVAAGERAAERSIYTDEDGDTAYIPAGFRVSAKKGEQTIHTGLVVIGPDGSEFIWVPTTVTELAVRDFGSYFSGGDSISGYRDETNLKEYQAMAASTERYGGFYIGRFEASKGDNGLPASRRVTESEPG